MANQSQGSLQKRQLSSSSNGNHERSLKQQGSFQVSSELNQEIFAVPRGKSRSRDRRESRMFLVDGQICWSNDQPGIMMKGKRTSSVGLFGSSMDLSGIGQSIDSSGGAGSGSEEAISYRIKWCRENILQLKRQTWPMEKKLQVLKASKMFIKQHQGELKQSKQAKDVIASTTAIFERYWRHFKREFANFLVIITPWEMRIKKIESHFGSVVASYFTFLRWIFWLNLANSLVMVAFVMVPELIENVPDLTAMRKGELGAIQPLGPDGKPKPPPEFNPTLGEMWEFEGFLKFSPIFYGYYSNVEISKSGFWRNPLAFLMSAALNYLFCFFCISRKLSQNTKLSRIGSKDDEYTFCWTVFVGWDFMIGNSETAYNKTSSLVMNLKEGILEEKEQTKDRDWRLIIRRVMANVLTVMLILASAYVVTVAVQRSENLPEDASLLQKNELQLVMSGIQFMFPPLFDVIGIMEKYHPRKALSWQLGRILFLDFLNFYTLMFSLFGTVDQMGVQLNEVTGNITLLRKNATYYNKLFASVTTTTTTTLAPEATTLDLNLTTTISGSNFSMPTNDTMSTNVTLAPVDTSSNASATTVLLTSVMLASSTMMPSNFSASNGLTDISSVATLTTTLYTSSTLTSIASSGLETSTSGILGSSMTSTSEGLLIKNSQSTTPTSPKTSDSTDDDYLDLGEVLKASPRLTRRELRDNALRHGRTRLVERPPAGAREVEFEGEVVRFDETEREYSAVSEDLTRRTTLSSTRRPFTGAFIPPIQDPYRQLGRAQWTTSGWQAEPEEEEPLEGRLPVKPPKQPGGSPSKRPHMRGEGVARPIGGKQQANNAQRGSRVRLTTAQPLDDDINEDLMEQSLQNNPQVRTQPRLIPVKPKEPSVVVADGLNQVKEHFSEPTTAGSDYSILTSSEVATASSTSSSVSENEQSSQQPGSFTIETTPTQSNNSTALEGTSSELTTAQIGSTYGEDPQATTQTSELSTPSCTTVTVEPLSTISSLTINGTSKVANLKKAGFNASEVSYSDCIDIPEVKYQEILALNDTLKDKLKTLCWETMFGQEMVKIVVMDLVMTVISAVSFEFMRACFVRYCNRFFFWDLERGFPGYQDFKLAENVLHLVNNQSTVWMGMFFGPGLPAINTVKLAVLMYVRSWAVLTCNIPHETVFKVSKSNNFYYWILLINLLICILPVAYAVTWIRPSWHCGPFAGECRMYIVVTKLVKQLLPPEANSVFKYLTSPGAVIPILIALILIIYYLASTVSSSKEANKELKAQLKKDKEQESAVPEITNTTVVDLAPTSGGPAGPAAPGAVQPNLFEMPQAEPSALGQNTLAPSLPPTLGNILKTSSQEASIESRPKTLLAPPGPG